MIVGVAMLWPLSIAVVLIRRPRRTVMNELWLFACQEADRPTYAAVSIIGCGVGGVAYIAFELALIAIPVGVVAGAVIALVVKSRRSVPPR